MIIGTNSADLPFLFKSHWLVFFADPIMKFQKLLFVLCGQLEQREEILGTQPVLDGIPATERLPSGGPWASGLLGVFAIGFDFTF